jgi:outer membrane biosynthesis protein TonB
MSETVEPSLPPSAGPSRASAAMRAETSRGPRVLRIGVVRSGRVVEERIITRRAAVTVGASDRNTFVVEGARAPDHFKLFDPVGGAYHLTFTDAMSGRLALQGNVVDLTALRARAEQTAPGVYRIGLTGSARGKIVIGETTLLFQFVAPPPVQPRPQLPVTVLRGATSIDWNTTIIAAVSFLIHFTAIGALYSDWLDPVVDYDVNVSGIIESVKSLPPPPPIEEPQPEEKPTEVADKPQEVKPQAKSSAGPSEKGPMTSARAAALTNELSQIELSVLGALQGLGPATANVLDSGEVPTGALDRAAASAAGVGAGGIGLALGGGGGTIRPGEAGGGIGSIGATTTGGGSDTGKAVAVKGPQGNADVGGTSVSGGEVTNAARVVAAMRAGFRRCYTRALATNPDVQGRINLSINVGPGGEVSGVSAAASGNLPADVIGCVQARARQARFDPPQGGMAVIQVPVTFVKQ